MTFTRSHPTLLFYKTASEIPAKYWKLLRASKSHYFTASYLSSLEVHHPNMDFLYALCLDEKQQLRGFVSVQVFDFSLESLETDWQNTFMRIGSLARKLKLFPKRKPLRILNCGLPHVSGNHGVFLLAESDQKRIVSALFKGIQTYVKQSYKEAPIDIFMVKDFPENELHTMNELINMGYYAFNVEPNMVVRIPNTWKSLSDYTAALKTKFRVKTNKALQRSQDLEIEILNSSSIASALEEMTRLFRSVTANASFNLTDFNLASYERLLQVFPEDYFVKTYRFQGKLVGFSSGLFQAQALDAHFVGIDYTYNKSLAIYQRMLYDYIDMAIQRKVVKLNLGRTASEIKSSVGATPEHLTVYIRHKKSITNKFLQLFLHRIQPSEFQQKFPFKKDANS